MQPDSNYRDELLRVQQIANPDFKRGGHVSLDDLHAKYAEGGSVMADELARVQSIINAVP